MSVAFVAKQTTSARGYRRRAVVLTLVGAAILIWGGSAWWQDRRYKLAMEEIEAEIVGRRYAIACRKLDELLSWNADPKGGIVYLLGSCELARGRPLAASEAWARVVPGTAFSDRAIRGRMRLLHESGRLAAAEEFITAAAADPRNDRTALLVLLVPLYGDEGRIDEARRLISDRWAHLKSLGAPERDRRRRPRARHQTGPPAHRPDFD